jgi:microsomal dipeptidase-like Zn-dependent dipeptidase
MPLVTEALLRRGLDESLVRKALGGNLRRILGGS